MENISQTLFCFVILLTPGIPTEAFEDFFLIQMAIKIFLRESNLKE